MKTISNNKKNNETIPWVEKYRPNDLTELIGHEHTVSTIRTFIQKNSLPNLLFYGPPGTGKTSTMIACAKEMYGSEYSMMVLELNASDARGIKVVRETIKGFAETRAPIKSNFNCKIIILDEADSMTRDAQAALRRIMEKYSANTRFCLICNYVNKIIPALQSRCTKFKFKQIPIEAARSRVKEICSEHSINITDQAVDDTIILCEGDMRKVVNMLQSINISLESKSTNESKNKEVQVDRDFIYAMTGYPHPNIVKNILENLLSSTNVKSSYDEIYTMMKNSGISLAAIIKNLTEKIVQSEVNEKMKGHILIRMAEIEHNLSLGCLDVRQLGGLVGAFFEVRHITA